MNREGMGGLFEVVLRIEAYTQVMCFARNDLWGGLVLLLRDICITCDERHVPWSLSVAQGSEMLK